ncbi:MAG: hypothetical protein K9G76_06335 [Bacteroidales bacterium]|nr:hypothetical protein [Bacteroidales bacterium]MCF8402353.1 hypothetical protein [Bacteroidales bacterium]
MKTNIFLQTKIAMKQFNKSHIVVVAAFLLFSIQVVGQAYLIGGYQGGIYGEGGGETFKDIPPPRNLTALGGDGEVFLTWESPLPLGEIRHDDNSAEFWYWLNNPSANSDLFYVQFETPVSGDITHIAVLNAAVSSASWDKIMICPDDGFGKPALLNPWESFIAVYVSTIPESGGEWAILSLTTPQTVSYNETFYVVTKWPGGSTTGPFVGADGGSDAGRSAYSLDNGSSWTAWPQNFIMRAFMVDDNNKSLSLTSSKNENPGYIPVVSLISGEILNMEFSSITQSLKIPQIIGMGLINTKSPTNYKVYRATSMGGPYGFVDNAAGLAYTDNTASNNTEYFYVVTAVYAEGESDNSNEAVAYPQNAAIAPFTNNFDINDGGFYGIGDWQWGIPSYAGGPASANSPPNVWGTVLDGNYNNLTSSWLILPFDLGSPVIYELNFAYWHDIESGFDNAYFAIDHNYDGVYDIVNTYTGSSGGWQTENMIIPDNLCTPYSRFAFILISNTSNVNAGLYIDDVSIDRYFDVDITTYLEGPYNGSGMSTGLNLAGEIPLSQPFNVAPWNYTGSESVVSVPNANVVDWILLEVRDAIDANSATGGTILDRQAAFIMNTGNIVGIDGSSPLRFEENITNQLFAVVWHHNHLSVMSANALSGNAGSYTYNFTTGSGQAFGGVAAHKEISTGVWGMVGGDGDRNGMVSTADKSPLWEMEAGLHGYLDSDYNLDAESDNKDKDDIYIPNVGSGSQVPN